MKNFNDLIVCPVPREQRPFYEYLKSRKSEFVGWVSLNELGYKKNFFLTFFFNNILSFFLTNYFMSCLEYPIRSLIIIISFSLVIQTLIYSYFLTNWTYVGSRLLERKVFYEEAGWYNEKIWKKPQVILKQEIILYNYQIVPLITRLKKTLQLITIVLILFLVLFLVLFY
jgi:hypothetical protein